MKLVMAREQPVEESGAGAADMEKAGWRRSKANGDTHGIYVGNRWRPGYPIAQNESWPGWARPSTEMTWIPGPNPGMTQENSDYDGI
jgi:hypothetical protein